MISLPMGRYLDHAVLKPELSRNEAVKAIELGLEYQVRTVCVRPCDISLALDICRGTETEVSCVLAFPHGQQHKELKAKEAEFYRDLGVNEIDMVVNYGYIRSELWDAVEQDTAAVSRVTKPAGIPLKAILETNMLTPDEITQATRVAIAAQADFVKSSTGFNGSGATFEAVKTMIDAAQGRIMVKASGGIRDRETAEKYIEMGCTRLGVGFTTTPVLCGGSNGKSSENY